MPPVSTTHTIARQFEGRSPSVKVTFAKIVAAARKLRLFHEEPKKTSIHLAKTTAFAGVAARKTALIVTLKSKTEIARNRIARRERASANRRHPEIRLQRPGDVYRRLTA